MLLYLNRVTTSSLGTSNLYREYLSSRFAPPQRSMGTPNTDIEMSTMSTSSIVLGAHPRDSSTGAECPQWDYVPPTSEMEEHGLSPSALTHIISELNQKASTDFDAMHPGLRSLPIIISFCALVGTPALSMVKGYLVVIGIIMGIASMVFFTLKLLKNAIRAQGVVIENTNRFIDEELNGNSKPWFEKIRFEMNKESFFIEITSLRPERQDTVISSVAAAVAQEQPFQTVYQKSVYQDSV